MYFQKPCRCRAEYRFFVNVFEARDVRHVAERIPARHGKREVGTDDDPIGAHGVDQIAENT